MFIGWFIKLLVVGSIKLIQSIEIYDGYTTAEELNIEIGCVKGTWRIYVDETA